MYSRQPKVLHPIGGKAMLAHVIQTAQTLAPQAIHVVIGHGKEQVQQQLAAANVNWVEQTEQLGTDDAVQPRCRTCRKTGARWCYTAMCR